MMIAVSKERPESVKADVLVIPVFENEIPGIDAKIKNSLADAIKKKEFTGEFKQVLLVSSLGNIAPGKVLFFGLGNKKDFSSERMRRAAGMSTKISRQISAKHISFLCTQSPEASAEGVLLGNYEFSVYKTVDRHKIKKIDSLTMLSSLDMGKIKKIKNICDNVNYVRDLVNTPANNMTPSVLAEEAMKIRGIKTTVYGKNEIKKMGMNAILAVSAGSAQEPKLIVMEYKQDKKVPRLALVGKGVTFDSGGIDLKPPEGMETMKGDMAGGAAVIGIMKAVSELKLPYDIIGVVPAVENMPGQSATHPGDIIKAYNGKTIEVVNTDAEGRLILADALSFTEKHFRPDAIIDFATLTGAVIVALGYFAAGMLGNDEKLMKRIDKAACLCGERVWQLPMWDDYKELMKGDISDLVNSPKGSGYGPGTIRGAVFLNEFVDKVPWAHIDIAATSWFPEEKEYNPKGATGYGVRLITQFLEDWK